jgi:uncharacterized phosphosugar-binding protein
MNYHPEHTWGHTIAFGEEYYQNAVKMLREIHADAGLIAAIAARAADALRSGHKVCANMAIGHMPPSELDNEREGNPALFEAASAEQLETMGEGDVLLTVMVNNSVRQARDAGAYVVVFTTPYLSNRNTPPNQIKSNENDWMPEDVATLVVDSHIPWEHGLVHVPEIPEMAVCPGSSIGGCAIHWMVTAEVAHALETGTTPDGSLGRRYLDILLERLAAFHARDLEHVNEVAATIAKRIIAGGRYFVRSRNKGVELDAYTVAQGLMLCNTLEQRGAGAGGEKDILLIAAVSADDPQELEWADEGRANGNYIVGIGPPGSDGLRQRCDVYFENGCDEQAGVIDIPGRDEKVCPATGILNLIFMYMITAQFVDEMCRRGAVPYFWMGIHRLSGRDYNKVMEVFFRERGY